MSDVVIGAEEVLGVQRGAGIEHPSSSATISPTEAGGEPDSISQEPPAALA
jgi:hypothetical protein